MTRKYLQWRDVRPTHLRAAGRSGVSYDIEQETSGAWSLTRFADANYVGTYVDCGWLADMKARAELMEADARGIEPEPQVIVWTRIAPGHYWGVAPVGLAYRILKIGRLEGVTIWRLEKFPNEDAEIGTVLDDGPLATLKTTATRDATDAAREQCAEEVA